MSMIYAGQFPREMLTGVRKATRGSLRMQVQVLSSFKLILSGDLQWNSQPCDLFHFEVWELQVPA